MTSSMVRKSLAIVDTDFQESKASKNKKTNKSNNKRLQSQQELPKHSGNKLTIAEARKKFQSRDQILKKNLQKLKILREAGKVDLDRNIADQIVERATTGRPVKAKKKPKADQKTAFTEEDFKSFEAEYFG